MQNKDKIIINKLIKYCGEIENYVVGMNEKDFADDNKTVFACAFCLGQIGELTKKVSEDTKNTYRQIAWHKIYGLRNRIVHDYEGVNLSRLWIIISEDIPHLKTDLRNVMKILED